MFKNKVKRVTGFVTNRKTGHVSDIVKQKGAMVNSIGFTHNKNDRAEKVKLKHNINPNDSRDCYAKTKVEVQRYNTYRNNPDYVNYRIHKEDKPTIQRIILENESSKNKKKK